MLLSEQVPSTPTKPKHKKSLVVNLSNYKLTDSEESVLSLGLNYAIPQKSLPVKEIIASTEQTTKFLNHRTAQDLRERVKHCIEDYKDQEDLIWRRSNFRHYQILRTTIP